MQHMLDICTQLYLTSFRMQHLPHKGLSDLTDVEKLILLSRNRGLLKRVAEKAGKSLSTVSRVYWHKTKRSDAVYRVLNQEVRRCAVQPLQL